MLLILKIIFSLLIGYLIGSIPTAYLLGRLTKGIDIRDHGSGNTGATNAFRVLGKGPGIVVLLIDICKGILPVALLPNLFQMSDNGIFYAALGLSVVAGHNWTCFLNFRGGKGIATSLGVLIGLTIAMESIRLVVLITFFSWLVIFLATGFVSLASIVAATVLPIIMVITSQPLAIIVLGACFCIFVVFRHRLNIQRLLSGQESRVRFFSKK